MSVLRSRVLVQNHLIMVAGAGSSSGPATDPYQTPGARRPQSTDGEPSEADHWSVVGESEVSAAERRLRAFEAEERRLHAFAAEQRRIVADEQRLRAFAAEQRRRAFVAEQRRQDEAVHRRALTAAVDWQRLVCILFRIRRLQRIWGHLGQFLQQVASKDIREDLRRLL